MRDNPTFSMVNESDDEEEDEDSETGAMLRPAPTSSGRAGI